MSPNVFLWFLLGLGALVIGAEVLVRGASGLARSLGVSSLVVGLTVVAFGTSAPELSISLLSLLKGQADLSVGNVIGSNIANILLILGSSALLAPLVVSRQLVRFDVPIMIAVSFLVLILGWNGRLDLREGAFLVVVLIIYTVVLIRIQKKKDERDIDSGEESSLGNRRTRAVVQIVFVLVGLVLLVKGAGWLVDSATLFARWLGVSDLVIGLTVVAGGTSLPELATSLIAAIRGERDIAIGNVVGSCIMNLLMVLGVASFVAPSGIELNPALFSFDLPVMIAVSVACLPIFFTDHLIARWEGALFLGYYTAYVTYLVMRASHHDSLPIFNGIMLAFVMPLTVITLALLTIRAWRKQRGSPE